jgi:hypothetical protein
MTFICRNVKNECETRLRNKLAKLSKTIWNFRKIKSCHIRAKEILSICAREKREKREKTIPWFGLEIKISLKRHRQTRWPPSISLPGPDGQESFAIRQGSGWPLTWKTSAEWSLCSLTFPLIKLSRFFFPGRRRRKIGQFFFMQLAGFYYSTTKLVRVAKLL